jgi:glycosyltransferase involved in cell wall biosynthesis
VSYIGFARKESMISDEQYKEFKHLPYKGSNHIDKLLNYFYMLFMKFWILKKDDSDLVWIWLAGSFYHAYYFLFPLIFKKKLFFIQLGAVAINKSKLKREGLNFICRFNLLFYNYVGLNLHSKPSQLLIKTHKINIRKIIEIDVGMPDYGFSNKIFDNLRMVYLGSLNKREVNKTIEGIAIFLKKHPEVNLMYYIIGKGSFEEVERINFAIKKNCLINKVLYLGFKTVEEVKIIYKECNVGVAFIPVNSFFQNNSTKTIEYLLSGMAVIATNNSVRATMIDDESGILCEDNPHDFAEGLWKLYCNFPQYNSSQIRKKYMQYSISETMKKKYFPQINKLIENRK